MAWILAQTLASGTPSARPSSVGAGWTICLSRVDSASRTRFSGARGRMAASASSVAPASPLGWNMSRAYVSITWFPGGVFFRRGAGLEISFYSPPACLVREPPASTSSDDAMIPWGRGVDEA